MKQQDWNQSQYYQEDFLVSHSVQPGSEEARKMTVTSGQKCLELYKRSDPVGSLVRMLLGSSAWRSTRCYLTWKASATPARRLLFRLVPSMPRTEETVVPFWPTPTTQETEHPEMIVKNGRREAKNGNTHSIGLADAVMLWPTPRANDAEKRGVVSAHPRNGLPGAVRLWPTPTAEQCGMTARTGGRPIEKSTKLSTQVYLAEKMKLLPTPIASDWKNRGCKDYRKNRQGQLQTTVGGQLNPTWVEWLMGFPLGWTDLDA